MECALLISGYRPGRVVLINARNSEELAGQSWGFSRPMGIAVSDERIAIATREEILIFAVHPVRSSEFGVRRSSSPCQGEVRRGRFSQPVLDGQEELHPLWLPLGKGENRLELNPNLQSAICNLQSAIPTLFTPEAAYFTGETDTHDLVWGEDGLWAVNTLLSSLMRVNGNSQVESLWRPRFVSDLKPEDRCHLNGVAMVDGRPRYATALGNTNTNEGWRKNQEKGGVLIEVASDEIMLGGLPMPHSPRVHDGKLYLLLSATGEVIRMDARGTYEVITRLPGFVRGLACYKNYLFVGLSKIRPTSSTFKALPVSERSTFSGVAVVQLHDGRLAGHLRFETGCDEIYDVQTLPGLQQASSSGSREANRITLN
jgi:uncharacterized protein (TIGR03032 family)